jgi:hypothetical protein
MKHRPLQLPIALLLLPLLTLAASCSTAPRSLVVDVPRLPLPQEARQPAPPVLCQPSCSTGLASLLNSLQRSPTIAAAPASPASASGRLTP